VRRRNRGTHKIYDQPSILKTLSRLPKTPVAMRAKFYASLGVPLEYDHVLKLVRATAESACVPGRVRRGTCPHGTHILEIWLPS
jgi:hypothetical protein